MPPKKDVTGAPEASSLLIGFDNKETKLLAAAFVSCIGPDKFDYDLMATLTGNTAGSLKKMLPPVKKKAIDNYPSFATFHGAAPAPANGDAPAAKTAATSKGAATRKRKNAAVETEGEEAAEGEVKSASDGNKSDAKKKKAPAKPRAKKVKKDESEDEKVNDEDAGEGMGEGKD